MKRWDVLATYEAASLKNVEEDIVKRILHNRGLKTNKEIQAFYAPRDPQTLTSTEIGIDSSILKQAIARIQKAIHDKESIVVYADYDADGITAGAIMWEALHALGASVMPYIPHREDEGYGLSKKGIDAVVDQYHPTLIITVDHGITAYEKVQYAKSLGVDVIITDHHTKPDTVPDCLTVHTTTLSGSGVSWFVAKTLLDECQAGLPELRQDILTFTTIGTIADLIPLIGINRSIVSTGLKGLNTTKRVGLLSLIRDAGLVQGSLGTYEVGHMLAPRLNAMGRIEHALDALRLLCTKKQEKADTLAQKLGMTNKDRQQLTLESTMQAMESLKTVKQMSKILIVISDSFNQGVIGLVAGRLVEEYYRPAIVIAKGELVSKASARSIAGFNITEAIRTCSELLVDVGGHPMAAGFTIETRYLSALKSKLEELADVTISDEQLVRVLKIDLDIPLHVVNAKLWNCLHAFEPFGFGNPEPVFVSRNVKIATSRVIGNGGKHLKAKIVQGSSYIDAIIFNIASILPDITEHKEIDIAYTIDMNTWNGNTTLQLKIKDIHPSTSQ